MFPDFECSNFRSPLEYWMCLVFRSPVLSTVNWPKLRRRKWSAREVPSTRHHRRCRLRRWRWWRRRTCRTPTNCNPPTNLSRNFQRCIGRRLRRYYPDIWKKVSQKLPGVNPIKLFWHKCYSSVTCKYCKYRPICIIEYAPDSLKQQQLVSA